MDAPAPVAADPAGGLVEVLIDALELGVLLEDRDGRALVSNPAARRLLGLSAAELADGRPLDPRWQVLREDGRPLPPADWPASAALRTGRTVRDVLLAVRHPDAVLTWVSVTAHPLEDAAVVSIAAASAARGETVPPARRDPDEAALRATTSRLENLVQNLHGGVMVEDEQRRVLLVNAEMLAIFGITDPPESRVGTSSPDGVRAIAPLLADPQRFVERFEEVVAAGVPVRGEEIVLADGRTFERDYIPVTSGSGEGGHMWLYRDVSRRKDEEREAARLRDEAIRAARLKTEFLATMSHEIRTPINGVLATIELLLDTVLEPHQLELAALVRDASAGLLTVVDDALDLSKIEAEKLEPRIVDMDLAAVVEGVADVVLSEARRKGLALSVHVDPRIPARLRGDAQWLRQVLVNLAGNALKFTAAGEVRIAAELVIQGGGSTTVRFSVEDTGPGIPAAGRERLFEPFVQGGYPGRQGGTGLGLAICRRLVGLMGGELALASEPGEGSAFSFSLALGTSAQSGPLDAARGLRVLIVEPRPACAATAGEYLGAWGVEAECAGSPEDARARAAAAVGDGRPFDVAIVGVGPPQHAAGVAAGLRALAGCERMGLVLLKDVGAHASAPDGPFARELARPLKQSRLYEAVVGAAASAGEVRERAPALPAGLRVLVAEDDVVSRELMLRQLAKLGVEADAVATGRAAVDAVGARPYDAVLMDLRLPELDGAEAARAIRRLPGERGATPVVVVSGAPREAGLPETDGWLRKPASTLDLARALERALPPAAIDAAALARLESDLGDRDELVRIAGIYLDQLREGAARAAAAARSGQAEELRRAAHRLGSASATFGARRVAELCRRLESLDRPDAELAAQLAAESGRAEASLRGLLERA